MGAYDFDVEMRAMANTPNFYRE